MVVNKIFKDVNICTDLLWWETNIYSFLLFYHPVYPLSSKHIYHITSPTIYRRFLTSLSSLQNAAFLFNLNTCTYLFCIFFFYYILRESIYTVYHYLCYLVLYWFPFTSYSFYIAAEGVMCEKVINFIMMCVSIFFSSIDTFSRVVNNHRSFYTNNVNLFMLYF